MEAPLSDALPEPAPSCRKPARRCVRVKEEPEVDGPPAHTSLSGGASRQPSELEAPGSPLSPEPPRLRQSPNLKGPKAFASSPIASPMVLADAQPPVAFIPEIDPGDLTVFESVGEGVTAEVYRGSLRQGFALESVAIKKMFVSRMAETEKLRFSREITVLSRLVHSNLTLLFGVSFNPLQIVTEFCSGGTCFDLLHNRKAITVSRPQRLSMCEGVASAMQYLHGFLPPIIHRDLKSLNVLLESPVRCANDPAFVKVTDFGLARMQEEVNGEATWGKMTRAVGTVHWMAPEVLTRTDYNERADVYSFAIFCYEVACREVPFADDEPATIARTITRGGRPSLDPVPADIPACFVELMTACWAHKPHHRPTFDEIGALLATETSPLSAFPQAKRRQKQAVTV